MIIKSNPQLVAVVTWVKTNMTLIVLGGVVLYVILRLCGVDVIGNLEALSKEPGIIELFALFGITGGYAGIQLLVKTQVQKELTGVTKDIDDLWDEVEKTTPPTTSTTTPSTPTQPGGDHPGG